MRKKSDPDIVRAMQQGVASVRLEGLEPSSEAQADMDSVTRGKLTVDAAVERAIQRAVLVKVQR